MRQRNGQKKVGVVNREKVAVLSKGTLIEADMVRDRVDAQYVMAIAELPPAAVTPATPAPSPPQAPTGGAAATDSAGAGASAVLAGPADSAVRVGLCFVDVASAQVLVGEFHDDEIRSHLRTYLTAMQPVELVLPAEPLSGTTARVLRAGLRDPQKCVIRGQAGRWDADKALKQLTEGKYFTASAAAKAKGSLCATTDEEGEDVVMTDGDAPSCMDVDVDADVDGGAGGGGGGWPAALRLMQGSKDAYAAALAALCGMVTFLEDALLDFAVLPMGRLDLLPDLTGSRANRGAAPAAALAAPQPDAGAAAGEDGVADGGVEGEDAGQAVPLPLLLPGSSGEPSHLLLNGAALENLELLENADGGVSGTLLAVLDHCTTPFGRRKLKQWLCRPLYRPADIRARQDAVADLMGPAAEAGGIARKQLAGISDLERVIARLHASTVAGGSGRDSGHVVLYEDAAKRKVKSVVSAVRDLQAVVSALGALQSVCDELSSSLLRKLVDPNSGRWRAVKTALAGIANATDWNDAEKTGRVVPAPGVDAAYDAARQRIRDTEAALQGHLQDVKQQLGCSEVTYIQLNKEPYVFEVPQVGAGAWPRLCVCVFGCVCLPVFLSCLLSCQCIELVCRSACLCTFLPCPACSPSLVTLCVCLCANLCSPARPLPVH